MRCSALDRAQHSIALGSNRQISMRLLTVMILAFFAFRTLLSWKADQLRMKDADRSDAGAVRNSKG